VRRAHAADHAEHRVEVANDARDPRDAKRILLALRSRTIAPKIADQLDIDGH